MMHGYGMGYEMEYSWIWAVIIFVLAGLAIAALVKYLRK